MPVSSWLFPVASLPLHPETERRLRVNKAGRPIMGMGMELGVSKCERGLPLDRHLPFDIIVPAAATAAFAPRQGS